MEALGLRDRVIFTGYLADEDLVVLLNLASRAGAAVADGRLRTAGGGSRRLRVSGDRDEGESARRPARRRRNLYRPECRRDRRALWNGCFRPPNFGGEWENAASLRPRRLTWEQAARQMMDVIRKVSRAMSRPLNFLHLTTFYPPYSFGGDAMYLYRLSHALGGATAITSMSSTAWIPITCCIRASRR